MQDSPNRRGVLGSKACGEPSLLLAVSVLHALRMAANAARSDPARGPAKTLEQSLNEQSTAAAGKAERVPPTPGCLSALLSSLAGPALGAPAPATSAAAQVC